MSAEGRVIIAVDAAIENLPPLADADREAYLAHLADGIGSMILHSCSIWCYNRRTEANLKPEEAERYGSS